MVHVVEQVGVALVEGGADAQVVADCTRGNVGVGAVGEELFEFVGAGQAGGWLVSLWGVDKGDRLGMECTRGHRGSRRRDRWRRRGRN